MRTGKSIYAGLKIVSQAGAEDLGTVKDLVFDDQTNTLLALLVSEKELFGLIQAQIVPWREVRSIGPDAVAHVKPCLQNFGGKRSGKSKAVMGHAGRPCREHAS